MKIKYFATVAIAAILGIVMGNSNYAIGNTSRALSSATTYQAKVKGCAGKNPCASKALQSDIYMDRSGIALKGQDVVAYFTQGKPVAGSNEYTYKWKGATWQFSSALHRDLFAKDPIKYVPQYGGYCAKAVSEGNLAKTDPDAWKIINGKLYLNYDLTVQAQWQQDVPGNIKKADAFWPSILNNRLVGK